MADMLEAESLPLFYQIAALLVLAAGVGVALRQPLVVSYIAVGLIARNSPADRRGMETWLGMHGKV